MTALSRLPLAAPLIVRDGRDVLAIGFDDVVKYHGRGMIGAAALAYRAMQVAFAALSPGGPVDRRAVSILSAFPVDGAADAFEMVTRCRTEGRYRVDPRLEVSGAAATATGRLFFQLTTPEGAVALGVRDEAMSEEHLDLVQADRLVRKHTSRPLDGSLGERIDALRLLVAEKAFTLADEELLRKLPPIT